MDRERRPWEGRTARDVVVDRLVSLAMAHPRAVQPLRHGTAPMLIGSSTGDAIGTVFGGVEGIHGVADLFKSLVTRILAAAGLPVSMILDLFNEARRYGIRQNEKRRERQEAKNNYFIILQQLDEMTKSIPEYDKIVVRQRETYADFKDVHEEEFEATKARKDLEKKYDADVKRFREEYAKKDKEAAKLEKQPEEEPTPSNDEEGDWQVPDYDTLSDNRKAMMDEYDKWFDERSRKYRDDVNKLAGKKNSPLKLLRLQYKQNLDDIFSDLVAKLQSIIYRMRLLAFPKNEEQKRLQAEIKKRMKEIEEQIRKRRNVPFHSFGPLS